MPIPKGVSVFVSKNKGLVTTILLVVAILVTAFLVGGQIKNTPVSIVGGVMRNASMITFDSYATDESASFVGQGKMMGIPSIAPVPPFYDLPASSATVPAEKKVIKNGSLDLLVKNAETTMTDINAIAEDHDGFVESSNIYEVSDGVKSGSVTLRVPAENYSKVLEAIKRVAVKVKNENTSSSDVTAQYVDLEAQIKNYKAEEAQYQEIMEEAEKIEDILSVASRLADVRGRIERAEGQLNYLSRQVAMSTIQISMTAEPEVEVFGIVWRPLTVLKQSVKAMFMDLAGFVDWLIMFLFKIPVYVLRLITAVVIVFVLWKIVFWLKRLIFG